MSLFYMLSLSACVAHSNVKKVKVSTLLIPMSTNGHNSKPLQVVHNPFSWDTFYYFPPIFTLFKVEISKGFVHQNLIQVTHNVARLSAQIIFYCTTNTMFLVSCFLN